MHSITLTDQKWKGKTAWTIWTPSTTFTSPFGLVKYEKRFTHNLTIDRKRWEINNDICAFRSSVAPRRVPLSFQIKRSKKFECESTAKAHRRFANFRMFIIKCLHVRKYLIILYFRFVVVDFGSNFSAYLWKCVSRQSVQRFDQMKVGSNQITMWNWLEFTLMNERKRELNQKFAPTSSVIQPQWVVVKFQFVRQRCE